MTINFIRRAPGNRIISFVIVILAFKADCRRYRYCSEGCCPEEYCAYQNICYPKMKCSNGCPDGQCVKDICMPEKPCTDETRCSFAYTCTMNYNLGYNTCQYNLDIGKTLCVDTKGNSLAKPVFPERVNVQK